MGCQNIIYIAVNKNSNEIKNKLEKLVGKKCFPVYGELTYYCGDNELENLLNEFPSVEFMIFRIGEEILDYYVEFIKKGKETISKKCSLETQLSLIKINKSEPCDDCKDKECKCHSVGESFTLDKFCHGWCCGNVTEKAYNKQLSIMKSRYREVLESMDYVDVTPIKEPKINLDKIESFCDEFSKEFKIDKWEVVDTIKREIFPFDKYTEINSNYDYIIISCGYEDRLKEYLKPIKKIASNEESDLILISTYDKNIYINKEETDKVNKLTSFLRENTLHGVCFYSEGFLQKALYISELMTKNIHHCAGFGTPYRILEFKDEKILVLDYTTESG